MVGHSKARPLGAYEEALEAAGLELALLRPATVLLSNVGDTRSRATFRAFEAYWQLAMGAIGRRERLGAAAAALLGPADRIACRLLPNGPAAKVLVARRVG